MHDEKQAALDALDTLLGCRVLVEGEKVKALREIEKAARRMAEGIERYRDITLS